MEQRSPKDVKQDGGIVISEEVLASIAATAARGVEGVASLVPRAPRIVPRAPRIIPRAPRIIPSAPRTVPRPSGLARLLRRQGDLRYVRLTQGGGELTLELTLLVRTGVNIAALACDVQRAVKAALQDMTGKTVARVNLKIAGSEN